MTQRTVHDRLLAATSILQVAIMARDTPMLGEKMWGSYFMPTLALEEALNLVISVLEETEQI